MDVGMLSVSVKVEGEHLDFSSVHIYIRLAQMRHLRRYFPLSAIVQRDTGAEISQTAIDGLSRGTVFSFLLWAKFRSCSHLCRCQPPQQDNHQRRWCQCYLTVHIITSEPKVGVLLRVSGEEKKKNPQKTALSCKMEHG